MKVTDVKCSQCEQTTMAVDGVLAMHYVNAVVCRGSRAVVEAVAVAAKPERSD